METESKEVKNREREKENSRVINLYDKAWTSGNVSLLERCISFPFLAHGHTGTKSISREKYIQSVSQFASKYIVLQFQSEVLFAKGDKIASAYTGELLRKKTQLRVRNFRAINIYKLRKAKIIELWFGRDELAFYQGLGILPSDKQIRSAMKNLD